MTEPRTKSWGSQWGLAVLFALLGLVMIYLFMLFAEPAERQHRQTYQRNYSEDVLVNRLTAGGISNCVARIAAASVRVGERQQGRFTGSPGFYRTEALIVDMFRTNGLDVLTQEFEVVVPETEYCEILGENGQPLAGVSLFPFEPAGLMPVALPPEGIKARLIQTESADLSLLAGNDPRESVVLTYLDAASGWLSLAGAGVPAVIVREDDVVKALRSDASAAAPWYTMVGGPDIGFPRFLARGPIDNFAGQTITIRCKVAWQTKKVRNLVGVLRGNGSSREALVLTSFYDSNSLVPDLAPGAEQSLSLAAMLQCAQALAPYRGQLSRDVLFVATAGHAQALAGVSQFMEAIETFTNNRRDYRSWEQRQPEHIRQLDYANHALALCDEMLKGSARETSTRQDPDFRQWFAAGIKVVAGEINIHHREKMLEAKLPYLRAGRPVFRDGFDDNKASDKERARLENRHPLLQTYLAAQIQETESANLMALPVWTLVTRPEFASGGYGALAKKHFEQLRDYHRQCAKEIGDSLEIRKLFATYDRTLTLNLDLYSGGNKTRNNLALLVGVPKPGTIVEPQVTDLANAVLANVPTVDGKQQFRVIHWGSRDALGSKEYPNPVSPTLTELESEVWFRCGRLAFTAANYDFYPAKVCTPEDNWDDMPLTVMQQQVPVLGRTLLSLAAGHVSFKSIQADRNRNLVSVHGTVLGDAGSASIIPSHPMGTRTFVKTYGENRKSISGYAARGITIAPILQTNPYGRFAKGVTFDLSSWGSPVSFQAARFDHQGRIAFINQATKLPISDLDATAGREARPVNLALFRCVPVALYDQVNPQTMQRFKGVTYLDRNFAIPKRVQFSEYTAFLEPDLSFFVGLLDGAAGNKELLTDRAFMLNVDQQAPILPNEPEVYGNGYLAADAGTLVNPAFDAAASMLRTAEKRLRLQERFGMADAMTRSFHKQAKEWLTEARTQWAQEDVSVALNAAGMSEAYAISNYPVIRARISQAVIGILWYLGLLVPFVFFTEKLLFGFPDIRKQLVAMGVIFLVVFALLRVFHPAFEMVRSSLMILLGFVILLLTFIVTLMVGGKFKQNLKELRGKEGQVEGADINRGGAIGTAFMLGLNNMRRRKVRTGLTCATLVLITFVMICFTSVSNDLVNVEQATGRSAWNGLMIRDPNFLSLDGAQVDKVRQIYGTQYIVAVHKWLVATIAGNNRVQNTEIVLDREFSIGANKLVKRSRVNAAIQMEWNEPSFSGIDRHLLTKKGWFPRPPETRTDRLEALRRGYREKRLIILPDTIAHDLGISPEDVNQGQPIISIRGVEFEVQGIIDSTELAKCQGLDGESILPFDLNSVQNFGKASGGGILVPPDIGRLTAAQVILVNTLPPARPGTEQQLTATCMVSFPKVGYQIKTDGPEFAPLDYRTQRRLVLGYLERTGQPAYYAIDGIAYYGSRQRATSFAGLLELLVPILIAALTVFNTMRGSVYERKSEIYVYNAVGIAPNHVFFMFMAEACVYAVIGAVLGYILSQGTGRLLTALDFTGGMNMDYSSIETIYASLAIMGSVLLSTIIPARDAAKLAAPSDIVSWTVPKAEGDVMTFSLPFTFTPHDRVAVVSYFQRWLDANGAGSSGPFFCSPPAVQLTGETELVPVVVSTVWLKPYDLGVSQRMEISLPTDPETTEYIARITLTRLSGHVAGWNRTLRPFLGVLRKQFLNWRATTDGERQEMFADASRILTATAAKEESHA